jgi:hypothetical protein
MRGRNVAGEEMKQENLPEEMRFVPVRIESEETKLVET